MKYRACLIDPKMEDNKYFETYLEMKSWLLYQGFQPAEIEDNTYDGYFESEFLNELKIKD